ncbi:hypothetical protein TCSYLVIO_001098 [Trypanosoma cruzi]|nr:hypothetical protein TCSYLVIO_001098 [Trypanosoma cruzi]
MGCCSSKEDTCGLVYMEMRRRLGVTPTSTEDAASTTRRNSEFRRILAMNRGKCWDTTGAVCATVEQLQIFAHETWQLSSVHAYNEQLLRDAAEDICRFNSVFSAGFTVVLRRCDYRPWLLCMCEFYRVMSVFEKFKLLANGGWERKSVTALSLTKCLNALKTEFASAFASSKGPGSAFQPPASASAAAVLEEVSRWSRHSLSVGEGDDGGASTRVVPLVNLVRWLVLRHVMSLSSEWTPSAPATPKEREKKEEKKEEKEVEVEEEVEEEKEEEVGELGEAKQSWNELFLQKRLLLRRVLGDALELTAFFDAITRGTQRLSEADAKTGMYEHFAMEECFESRSINDTLVQLAFRAAVKEWGDDPSCIKAIPPFRLFLQAYIAVLELYLQVMRHEGISRGKDPLYGSPAPDLDREFLRHVLKAVCSDSDGSNDDCAVQVVRSLFGEYGDSRQVSFLQVACAWTARLVRMGKRRELKDISELFHALGLCDQSRRASLLSLLVAHGWESNETAAMFNALRVEVDLPSYSHADEVACACVYRQWVTEWEMWERVAASSGEKGDGRYSYSADGNSILADIHLRRLLHGVYGAMVAVRALEETFLQDDSDFFTGFNKHAWSAETPVPMQARSNVLRVSTVTLGLQGFGEAPARTNEGGKEQGEMDGPEMEYDTVLSLVQYVSSYYVADRMQCWKGEAWRRLQTTWPVSNGDARLHAFFRSVIQQEYKTDFASEGEIDGSHSFCDKLYAQYASDVLLIMSSSGFRALCSKAVRVVGDPNTLNLTVEELPTFLRYVLRYMHVLISFGVPHNGHVFDGAAITWDKMREWVLRELGAAMDGVLETELKQFAAKHEDAVLLPELAGWFALRGATWGFAGARMHVWTHSVREMIPVRATAGDRKKLRELTSEFGTADHHIPIAALMELCSVRYKLWRVWPLELGSGFVLFCVRETNDALQRLYLQDRRIHQRDLFLLLLFIHTYLDVFLEVECMAEKGSAATGNPEVAALQEKGDAGKMWHSKSQDLLAWMHAPWEDDTIRSALQEIVRSRGLDEETLLRDILDSGAVPRTTSHMARSVACFVARATVASAFQQFCEKAAERRRSESVWCRLRERLPSDDSTEQRGKRQHLFTLMDVQGRGILTLCDLYRGMVELLALHEFREDLQPVVFRAFFATKAATFPQRSVVYLTDGNEQFITAAEFRAFLWYVYTYFELYHMFDTLCMNGPNPAKKEVSLEAFLAATPLLRSWGFCVDDMAAAFATISGRCKEGGAMYFTEFAMWASRHQLTPERCFQDEEYEQDKEEEEKEEDTMMGLRCECEDKDGGRCNAGD